MQWVCLQYVKLSSDIDMGFPLAICTLSYLFTHLLNWKLTLSMFGRSLWTGLKPFMFFVKKMVNKQKKRFNMRKREENISLGLIWPLRHVKAISHRRGNVFCIRSNITQGFQTFNQIPILSITECGKKIKFCIQISGFNKKKPINF